LSDNKPRRKATANSQQVVNINDRDGQRRALRAITVGQVEKYIQKSTESNQVEQENMFRNVEDLKCPPFDLLMLTKMPENSTELGQCVDAMVTNIEGFGGRFVPRVPKEDREKLQDELEREFEKLDLVFNNVNPDYDLTELRKRVRRDIETTGNGYIEILRDSNEDIHSMYHMESHSVRLTNLDKQTTDVEIPYVTKDYQIKNKIFKKRYTRFVQVRANKKVWFKEYGDPRIMDLRTGKIADENLDPKFRASEVLRFRLFSSSSSYGVPRYIGNLFSVLGSRVAEEINFVTFQNNNIPAMAVIVNNGQLTDGTIERIEEFVESHIKRSKNRSSFLILEAEPFTEDNDSNGPMKIELEDLTKAQNNDQLFQEYDKNNADKIRRCFRLPPIFVGRADDYTRATAESSRRLADEQVFSPERAMFDFQMNRLILDLGIKYWKFKSNSPNVTDDEDLVKVLGGTEKSGGMTPNVARMIIGDILNIDIPAYDPKKITFNPDEPFSLAMADRVKNTSGEAPNQGQIPNPDKVEKRIQRIENFSDVIEKYLDVNIFGEDKDDEVD